MIWKLRDLANNASKYHRVIWFFLLTLLFLCGIVVGVVIGVRLEHIRMSTILKNDKALRDNVLPFVRSRLDPSEEQYRRIEEIIQRHHVAMRSLKGECYNTLLLEFYAMKKEVAEILSSRQKSEWISLCDVAEERYAPWRPGPPSGNQLFDNFDIDKDGKLSEDEVFPRMWFHLRRADLNNDGFVTREEFEDTRIQPKHR